MVIKRNLIIFCSFINFYSFNGIRDPFKPVKKMKSNKELQLNAILVTDNNAFASVTYNDKAYVVTYNDNIEQLFTVNEIKDSELRLLDLDTNKEKIILLPS